MHLVGFGLGPGAVSLTRLHLPSGWPTALELVWPVCTASQGRLLSQAAQGLSAALSFPSCVIWDN